MTTPDLPTAAAALVALKEAHYAATRASGDAARADRLTSVEVDAALAAGRAVDEACEDFRRRFYPRAGRVITAQGEVFTISPKGRRIRCVWPA